MRQRHQARTIFAPGFHRLRHSRFTPIAQMPVYGVGADSECELMLRQRGQHPRLPQRRAFRPRWLVGARRSIAGKAEAHADDGDATFIVECVAINAQPLAQAVARRIIERQARLVHAQARRLRRNQKLRGDARADDGPHAVGQVWRAHAARANFSEEGG
jgi:hypothetical protein